MLGKDVVKEIINADLLDQEIVVIGSDSLDEEGGAEIISIRDNSDDEVGILEVSGIVEI